MVAAVAVKNNVRFEYTYLPINDLAVETETDEKTGRKTVKHVLVRDEPIEPTQRFWTSLFARYSFNKAIFRYFDHAEVFNRIAERDSNDQMRLTIERDVTTGAGKLMAASKPNNPVVVYDELCEMLEQYNGTSISYNDGIVESTHIPRLGGSSFNIVGDVFENRFILSTPVDGYGLPNIYLSLLRQICTNGMIGYSKTFRSSLALGKATDDVSQSLTRALDGFGNDEGYAALRQRVESAATSWASVYETTQLYKLLVKLHVNSHIDWQGGTAVPKGTKIAELLSTPAEGFENVSTDDSIGSPIIKAFHRLTGDTSRLYGLANIDALSNKRQRTLPVKCTVYDVINFTTEVATHHADPVGSRDLQAMVGTLVSTEYDMEGTKDKFGDFADFHLDAKLGASLTGSAPDANKSNATA